MTSPARVTQDDLTRTFKALVRDAGIQRARVIVRLEKSEIEVIIGEPDLPEPEAPHVGDNPWDSLTK